MGLDVDDVDTRTPAEINQSHCGEEVVVRRKDSVIYSTTVDDEGLDAAHVKAVQWLLGKTIAKDAEIVGHINELADSSLDTLIRHLERELTHIEDQCDAYASLDEANILIQGFTICVMDEENKERFSTPES